jgi:hypothetical protein
MLARFTIGDEYNIAFAVRYNKIVRRIAREYESQVSDFRLAIHSTFARSNAR